MGHDPERIADLVRLSSKYSCCDPETVRRISADIVGRHVRRKDAVRAVRAMLHIINASFVKEDSHAKAMDILNRYDEKAEKAEERLALSLMELHVSTRERLSVADRMFSFMGRYIHTDSRVVDIGCGFHPFAVSLYQEKPASYLALDIRTDTLELVNRFFRMISREAYRAEALDAVVRTPDGAYDVAFLLKLIPGLERQRKGRGVELLESLDFSRAFVSFSTRRMSGRRRGMEAFYSSSFEAGLPSAVRIESKAAFDNELIYVLCKKKA